MGYDSVSSGSDGASTDASIGDDGSVALACGAVGGSLDTSFGSGGSQTLIFGDLGDFAWALLRQPDGKLVASGRTKIGGEFGFAAARLSADGQPDLSFGGDGLATAQYNHDFGYSSALQSDGKLLISGDTWNFGRADDYLITRLHANGTLDMDFGTNGNVLLNFTSGDSGRSVAVKTGGEIVVAGTAGYTTSNADFAIVQLDSSGALDPTFGTGGQVRTDFGVGNDSVAGGSRGLHVFASGKIVVAGAAATGTLQDFALAQYTSEGALDLSFDNDGKVVTELGGNDIPVALVATQGDTLVVAGYSTQAAEDLLALVKYRADGSLDESFGDAGVSLTSVPGGGRIHGVVQTSDGSLMVAGVMGPTGSQDLFLARFCSDGSLDPMFGTDGFVVEDLNGEDDAAYDLVLQDDGLAVVLAQSSVAGISRFVLLRYRL